MNNIVMPMYDPDKVKPTLEKAREIKCPIEALVDSVILIQIDEPEKAAKGKIYIDPEIRAKWDAEQNFLVKGLIKSVGPTYHQRESSVKPGDVVYVYPGGQDSKIVINSIEYLVYNERDLKAKIK